jgi:hypothetical protein
MGLLSNDESIVWQEFQKNKNTGQIAQENQTRAWTPAYVSRVLNRAREKIAKTLKDHANSHRLDIETVLDYKGLLIGFDYQTSSQVYIIYTEKLGIKTGTPRLPTAENSAHNAKKKTARKPKHHYPTTTSH